MASKDPNSRNSIDFFIRNCLNFKSCLDHVKKHLKFNNLNDYEIKEFGNKGILALYIYKNSLTYIIYMDTRFIELKLICSEDDYKKCKIYPNEDCWAKVISEVNSMED